MGGNVLTLPSDFKKEGIREHAKKTVITVYEHEHSLWKAATYANVSEEQAREWLKEAGLMA